MLPSGFIPTGTVVNERFEVQGKIGSYGVRERILAFDRAVGHDVIVEVNRLEPGMSPAREAEEWVPLAQRVHHPNVCRVYGIEHCPWGPIVITEYVAGTNFHSLLRARKAAGGLSTDEFRAIATGLFCGLAAMHAESVIHSDIKPGKMIIAAGRAVIHGFWFAEAAESATRSLPPGAGTPNYMSPERLRDGGASFEDDVYAMAMTLWEAFTCRVPEPGHDPRARPMKPQVTCKNPAALLTTRELQQLFRALHPEPGLRPTASQMRFDATAHGDLPARDDEDGLFAEWTGSEPRRP